MLLMSRYWKVKTRDRAGAAIMFLQAPIIGIMLAFVFAGEKQARFRSVLGALQELAAKNSQAMATQDLLNSMKPTADHTAAMFFVVVSCVWFGTSNSAREIVTERAIYLRERMVNLGLGTTFCRSSSSWPASASSSACASSGSSSSPWASRGG